MHILLSEDHESNSFANCMNCSLGQALILAFLPATTMSREGVDSSLINHSYQSTGTTIQQCRSFRTLIGASGCEPRSTPHSTRWAERVECANKQSRYDLTYLVGNTTLFYGV
jgi:hypothetical protein